MARYCASSGCTTLIDAGRYCEQHRRRKKKAKPFYSNNKAFYNTQEWKDTADYVRYRDGYKCTICNKPVFGRNSQVDHIQPIWLRPDLKVDTDNLRLVCAKCHPKVEYKPESESEWKIKKKPDSLS